MLKSILTVTRGPTAPLWLYYLIFATSTVSLNMNKVMTLFYNTHIRACGTLSLYFCSPTPPPLPCAVKASISFIFNKRLCKYVPVVLCCPVLSKTYTLFYAHYHITRMLLGAHRPSTSLQVRSGKCHRRTQGGNQLQWEDSSERCAHGEICAAKSAQPVAH